MARSYTVRMSIPESVYHPTKDVVVSTRSGKPTLQQGLERQFWKWFSGACYQYCVAIVVDPEGEETTWTRHPCGMESESAWHKRAPVQVTILVFHKGGRCLKEGTAILAQGDELDALTLERFLSEESLPPYYLRYYTTLTALAELPGRSTEEWERVAPANPHNNHAEWRRLA